MSKRRRVDAFLDGVYSFNKKTVVDGNSDSEEEGEVRFHQEKGSITVNIVDEILNPVGGIHNDSGEGTELFYVDRKPKRCPWKRVLLYENLTEEMSDFVAFMSPTRDDEIRIEYALWRLKKLLRTFLTDFSLFLFGSSATDLQIREGDIDLTLILKHTLSERSEDKLVKLISGKINKEGIGRSMAITDTRVKIVRYFDKVSNLVIDLSINQTIGVKNNHVVNILCKEYKHLKKIVVVLKLLLQCKDLNDTYTGGLGTYALILLTARFLQTKEENCKMEGTELEQQKCGDLLIELLYFYGNLFNYEKVGISIRNGGRFFRKRDYDRTHNSRKRFSLMLEDPLEPYENVTRSSYGISLVQAAFQEAHKELSQSKDLASIIDPESRVIKKFSKKYTGEIPKYEEDRFKVSSHYVDVMRYLRIRHDDMSGRSSGASTPKRGYRAGNSNSINR